MSDSETYPSIYQDFVTKLISCLGLATNMKEALPLVDLHLRRYVEPITGPSAASSTTEVTSTTSTTDHPAPDPTPGRAPKRSLTPGMGDGHTQDSGVAITKRPRTSLHPDRVRVVHLS